MTALVYHADRAFEANPTSDGLRAIKSRIDARNQFISTMKSLAQTDAVFVHTYFPNYETFMSLLENEARPTIAPLGPPFTWDIDKLIKDGQLPPPATLPS